MSGAEGGQPPPFPPGFFDREDPTSDTDFYRPVRLVTHIDGAAIAAVGDLYAQLGIAGTVLDLMSSWISHFHEPPARLVGLGLNPVELDENPALAEWHAQDLNADPTLPFADASFEHAVCCVSVDYLVRPVAVFREVARVLAPGGCFVVTFSNRCFPTKAVRGWLERDDQGRADLVRDYFARAGGFARPEWALRSEPGRGDPLYGVWSSRTSTSSIE